MTFSHLPPWVSATFSRFACWLDRRTAARLPLLLAGLLLACGRRTATAWFRAAGITVAFRRAYPTIHAVGRARDDLAWSAWRAVQPCLSGSRRLTVALDDTPTPRYGPCVEGAGRHHNPTPGPAGEQFLYGHVRVTLAVLSRHPDRATLALPLRADLYVRQKDLPQVPPERHWVFRTKPDLAAGQLRWLGPRAARQAASLWAVVDGGYAKKPFLRVARQEGFTVVSRLRKGAALRSVPPATRRPGQRGPLPTYGRERLSLAKRAGQPGGWQHVECVQ